MTIAGQQWITWSIQLHYCPVNQPGGHLLTPLLSFLLPGHMGQIKGAFPFILTAAGLNHHAVANAGQVAGVSEE